MADRPRPSHERKVSKVTFVDKDDPSKRYEVDQFKTFRPDTIELLQALRLRLDRLPPHVLTALLEKWEERDRAIQISGTDSFFMPQTADEEDELVKELRRQMAEVEDELVRAQYAHSTAHVVALEQQLLALRTNSAVHRDWKLGHRGALQQATLTALQSAQTYCWSPQTVEAVAAQLLLLPDDTMPAEMPLTDLTAPAACGWWWFEQPIPRPVTTTGEPIVALLWRRELREEPDIENGMATFPGKVVSLTWFSVFLLESVTFHGRQILTPSPVLAWLWVDGLSVSELHTNLVQRFILLDKQGRTGVSAMASEYAADVAVWFSKFWMAAATWLESRVPAKLARARTPLPRQQGRHLQREHGLPALPTVEVVYLRRTEPSESPAGSHGPVTHDYCWMVREHPRRQWFPSLGRHQLVMVREHIRGPRDRPLKNAKRVYAVNR